MLVACKLPNGLDIGGFVLKGAHKDMLDQSTLRPIGEGYVAGYAITPNVPDDIWERWSRDNRSSPIVLNGLVHAEPTLLELEAWCYRNRKVSGTHRGTRGFSGLM